MQADPDSTSDPLGKWALVGGIVAALTAMFKYLRAKFGYGENFRKLTALIEAHHREQQAHRRECAEGFVEVNRRLTLIDQRHHDEDLAHRIENETLLRRLRSENRQGG